MSSPFSGIKVSQAKKPGWKTIIKPTSSWFLLDLLFSPENRGGMFLGNNSF
jgi:hypothetical protein